MTRSAHGDSFIKRLRPTFHGRRYWCFTVAMVLLIALSPLARAGVMGELFLGGYMTFILGLGIAINSDGRHWRVWNGALCVLSSSLFLAYLATGHALFLWSMVVLWLLFFLVLGSQILVAVLSTETVDSDVLFGAVSIYLLAGMICALLYWCMEQLSPGAFNLLASERLFEGQTEFATFQYYSYVTITTLGFGDITPKSDAARALTVLEAIFGVLFTAVFLGRMLSLYIAHSVAKAQKN